MNRAAPQSASAIEDHAIVGDLHTVALIDLRATIDFLCLWRLDGPSVFASLLDPRAGSFEIRFDDPGRVYRQLYVPDTNVLLTRVVSDAEVVEITDFMAMGQKSTEPIIVRKVAAIRGRAHVRVVCTPAFGYAAVAHRIERSGDRLDFVPADGTPVLAFIGDGELAAADGAAHAEFRIERGESRIFVLGALCPSFPRHSRSVAEYAEARLAQTLAFWRAWAGRSTYTGRYRELVMRSALALKLLVSSDHGSIAAAATFGLPEASGGGRNWDYRYSWIRDSSFAAYAFIRLGFIEEASALMLWIGRCLQQTGDTGPLQPLYRMDGSRDVEERELEHFAGYRGEKPVRIGNGAGGQLQLDVYGAFMDAVYLTSKYAGALPIDAWARVSAVIEWVCENWREPDEGIWEARVARQVTLHSRVMCWVAVDRAIRLAFKRSLPAPMPKWNAVRSDIHHSIVTDFWNADLQSFVRNPGSRLVDAAALMMPLVRLIGARDPKWRSTQARIEDELSEDGIVYRYPPGKQIDGMAGHEGAFTTCSFWLVECLARQGDTARAQLIFEKMIANGNHVGLYAEELGPTGEHLGNFPQALTHLALISAAIALDRALASGDRTPWA